MHCRRASSVGPKGQTARYYPSVPLLCRHPWKPLESPRAPSTGILAPKMTLRLRSLAALTLSLGLVLGSRMACAQNTDAQASFDQARTAFEAGQFGPALRGFQHVFEISGDHAVLFNIAVTYERLGQPGEAARTLRRFLVAEPDVSNRAEIEARIARLEDAERALASTAPAESASGADKQHACADSCCTPRGTAPPCRGSSRVRAPWSLPPAPLSSARRRSNTQTRRPG